MKACMNAYFPSTNHPEKCSMSGSNCLTAREVLSQQQLNCVFQPIVALGNGEINIQEVLIRGPVGTPLHLPDKLFARASKDGLRYQLEYAAIDCALTAISQRQLPGVFFINISGMALTKLANNYGCQAIVNWIDNYAIERGNMVFEITEHERVTDVELLKEIGECLNRNGLALALDDFGDGHSSLRLWAELQPKYIKIDRFFSDRIGEFPYKAQTYRALEHITEILGGTLIAEGIETADQLQILRDMGINMGQGYFLGSPASEPQTALPLAARHIIDQKKPTTLVARKAFGARQLTAGRLLIEAPTVTPDTKNDTVFTLFQAYSELHALAVIVNGKPVGLINRKSFMERYSRIFQKELLGTKPCTRVMNNAPKLLDVDADIEDMISLLTSTDQRFLSEGMILTSQGEYAGLATGEQMVKTVTEHRIEAARHANPLTSLPGNIPISLHIELLLQRGYVFHAAYCDLNHFKPFNDRYGYWRGDEMIRLLSKTLLTVTNNDLDFVGHVGGDDFVVIFQSEDWLQKCRLAVERFNLDACALFEPEDRNAGYIEAEDRKGHKTVFPLTTLAIGVVKVEPGEYPGPEDVANAAAQAKHYAKQRTAGLFIGGDIVEESRHRSAR
jgi:EAL domain-containing protein (putative c-di-GMP-specific phosphodiesterase class I)/GGDEF domain-containing protein